MKARPLKIGGWARKQGAELHRKKTLLHTCYIFIRHVVVVWQY